MNQIQVVHNQMPAPVLQASVAMSGMVGTCQWEIDNSGTLHIKYVAYNPNDQFGVHNYTTSSYEQNNLHRKGWRYGVIAWKVN